jgi:hypothetical protein
MMAMHLLVRAVQKTHRRLMAASGRTKFMQVRDKRSQLVRAQSWE